MAESMKLATKVLLVVALTGACGRIHYDPVEGVDGGTESETQVNEETDASVEETESADPVSCTSIAFDCPVFTIATGLGPQTIENDCVDSFSFRIASGSDAPFQITVVSLESDFDPLLAFAPDSCNGEAIEACRDIADSDAATRTLSLPAGETSLGVISGVDGSCGRFLLQLE